MIALIQRVTRASVTVEGEVTGEIGAGLLVLLGVERCRQQEMNTQTGRFAADMQVSLVNDGPVTFWLQV